MASRQGFNSPRLQPSLWRAPKKRWLPAGTDEGGLSRTCVVPRPRLRLASQHMPRCVYVYELVSKRDDAIRYRGMTRNLKARLRKRNAGGCIHTSKFRPWYIEVAVAFRSERKARALKSTSK